MDPERGRYHGGGMASGVPPYNPYGPYYYPPQQQVQQPQQVQQQRQRPPPPPSSTEWTTWLIPLFILVNIGMFVYTMYENNCPAHRRDRVMGNCVGVDWLHQFSFQPLQQNPLFGPSSNTLLELGALEWDRLINQHQEWRLITCIWLHAGVIHLASNMLFLIFVGFGLEKQFGFIRVGVIYLVSGIGGSMVSALFVRNSVSVGASGALFGLLGSMLSELITNWTMYTDRGSVLFSIVIVVALNMAIGLLPHVDNFAHIGGFITGILLGFILLPRPGYSWRQYQNYNQQGTPFKSEFKIYQLLLLAFSLILLVIWFLVGLIMLYTKHDGNNHCRWCHYLSCVPTSKWKC